MPMFSINRRGGKRDKMKIISIYSEIGADILTRNSIKRIFEKVNSLKEDQFILDFDKVNFISRSSCDEYLKQKNLTYKKLIEKNRSNNIKKMFNSISRAKDIVYMPIKNEQICVI